MTYKIELKDYGIEDICESLDGLEATLKKLLMAYCIKNGVKPRELE